MEKKYLNIEIPEGFEIDKDNSTFEKIVFKPIELSIEYKSIILHSKMHLIPGVEVIAEGEHFFIEEMEYPFALPWDDAVRYTSNFGVHLPSKKQLEIMNKHKNKINSLLKKSKLKESWYWSDEQYSNSDAWCVGFYAEYVHGAKSYSFYVRRIINL